MTCSGLKFFKKYVQMILYYSIHFNFTLLKHCIFIVYSNIVFFVYSITTFDIQHYIIDTYILLFVFRHQPFSKGYKNNFNLILMSKLNDTNKWKQIFHRVEGLLYECLWKSARILISLPIHRSKQHDKSIHCRVAISL